MVDRLKRSALFPLLLAITGCSERISDYGCGDLRGDVADISKGKIIKITRFYEVSRTASELICQGSGFYSSGDTIPTRYRAWKDEDGEIMIAWDTKEAQKAEAALFEAKAKRENDADQKQAMRSIDQAFDEASGSTNP